MTMFYLRAADEATMKAEVVRVLNGATVTDAEGDEQIVFHNHRWALDWIGPLDGSDDFHANLKILDPDALLDFPFGIESVNPVNPQREFA